MPTFLRHPLFLLGLLLAAFGLQMAWQGRNLRLARYHMAASGNLQLAHGDLRWLNQTLGELDASSGRTDLPWAQLDSAASQALLKGDGVRAVAARQELARWAEIGDLELSVAHLSVQELRIDSQTTPAALILDIKCQGDQAVILAWLTHLLAADPGHGYLTDPARIYLSEGADQQLHMELALRVWPARAFVQGGGEVGGGEAR